MTTIHAVSNKHTTIIYTLITDTTYMEEIFTFEQLPRAVSLLNGKVDSLIKRFDEMFGKTECTANKHELLDLSAAAKMLGKAESTIYSMTSNRIILFTRRETNSTSSKTSLRNGWKVEDSPEWQTKKIGLGHISQHDQRPKSLMPGTSDVTRTID